MPLNKYFKYFKSIYSVSKKGDFIIEIFKYFRNAFFLLWNSDSFERKREIRGHWVDRSKIQVISPYLGIFSIKEFHKRKMDG